MNSDHLDAFAVLAVAALMLAFVEFRLRALFARHEVREEKMHATAVLLADAAAAAAREAARHVEEIRVAAGDLRLDLENIAVAVKMHDGRLGAVEERLMRAALMVPSPRRPQDPPVP